MNCCFVTHVSHLTRCKIFSTWWDCNCWNWIWMTAKESLFIIMCIQAFLFSDQNHNSTAFYDFGDDLEDIPLGARPFYFDLGSLMQADPRGKRIEGYFSPSTTWSPFFTFPLYPKIRSKGNGGQVNAGSCSFSAILNSKNFKISGLNKCMIVWQ